MISVRSPRTLLVKEISMYANVVVGIDGLSGDADAVALANALAPRAERLGLAHVRVIDAVPSRGSVSAFDAAKRDVSRELLERQRASFAPNAEMFTIAETSVGSGLHDLAERRGVDLIVVGSCHRSTLGRILAGDDARSVLHHAPCAVAVAPRGYADSPRQTATIAAAYDGSDESEAAIAHATLLAADLDAKLVVRDVEEMHVYGAGSWASAAMLLEDPDTIVAGARARRGPPPAAR
jgi:nucleotide-binding universal stress UspA family protein